MTGFDYALSIDGRRVFTEHRQAVINPATEAVICDFPIARPEDLESVVAAAQRAFGG